VKIDIKIYIKNRKGVPFFGKGIADLLYRISASGSIRKAAGSMKMSYSKAHGIISRLENCTGKKILIKAIGGKSGGGSGLTPYAEKLIAEYGKLQKKIKSCAEKEFYKFAGRIKI